MSGGLLFNQIITGKHPTWSNQNISFQPGILCLQQAYSKTYQPTNFPFPTIHPTFYPVVNPANSPGVLPQGTFQHVLRLHVHGRRSELRQGPVQGHLRAVGQTYGVGFRMLERVKSFTYSTGTPQKVKAQHHLESRGSVVDLVMFGPRVWEVVIIGVWDRTCDYQYIWLERVLSSIRKSLEHLRMSERGMGFLYLTGRAGDTAAVTLLRTVTDNKT